MNSPQLSEEQSQLQREKAQFIKEHPEYGYGGRIDAIHAREFAARLGDTCYLDHCGSALYAASHVAESHRLLSNALLCNPHSDPATAVAIEQVRERVLRHLNTNSSQHSVVFTYNASAALALLGSIFPFSAGSNNNSSHCSCAHSASSSAAAMGSELALLLDNHNSVLGIREKLKAIRGAGAALNGSGSSGAASGARFSVVRPRDDSNEATDSMECACSPQLLEQYAASSAAAASSSCTCNAAAASASSENAAAGSNNGAVHPCLFIYPAESNFDGRLYPHSLAKQVKQYNFASSTNSADGDAATIDARAAATCASNPLSLHHVGRPFEWYVACDASALMATSPLDLSAGSDGSSIDFTVLSFYKMFGFPMGLAALVVRNQTAHRLWGVGGGFSAGKHAASSVGASSNATANPAPASAPPSLSTLRRYFAGGTVNAVIASEDFHVLRYAAAPPSSTATAAANANAPAGGSTPAIPAASAHVVSGGGGKLHELLEDGTPAVTSILALPFGFALFDALGLARIHAHSTALVEHLYAWLARQRYRNGTPLVKFYGARAKVAQAKAAASNSASASPAALLRVCFGAVLNFNFLTSSGGVLGYRAVGRLASGCGIMLRAGSFCNPGACEASYPLSGAQVKANLAAGFRCWQEGGGDNPNGSINGSLRISAGWNTRFEDVHKFTLFVEQQIRPMGEQQQQQTAAYAKDAASAASSNASSSAVSAAATPAPAANATASMFMTRLPSWFTDPPTAAAPADSTAADAASAPPFSIAVSIAAPASASTACSAPAAAGSSVAAAASAAPSYSLPASPYVLSELVIYPIKSCAGVKLDRWWIQQSLPAASSSAAASASAAAAPSSSSLFLDREFVLLDGSGSALSQKLIPQMQLIRPSIDVQRRTMTLRAPNMQPLVISLDEQPESKGASAGSGSRYASLCSLEVCGESALGHVYDSPSHAHISEWISSVIGRFATLARKSARIRWPSQQLIDQQARARAATLTVAKAPSTPLTPGVSVSCFPSPSPSPPAASSEDAHALQSWAGVSGESKTAPSSASAAAAAAVTPSASTVSAAPSVSPAIRSSFSNECDYLLVSAASVRAAAAGLHAYVASHSLLQHSQIDAHISPMRFRPNLVVDAAQRELQPYEEDRWTTVRLSADEPTAVESTRGGDSHSSSYSLRVQGGCARCSMVNSDPATAQRSAALYAMLNQQRKNAQGKIIFGAMLGGLTVQERAEQAAGSESAEVAAADADSTAAVRFLAIHVGMGCSAE